MRGQTTLDFAIGASLFLAVILFVFTFVPGLLDPFAVSGESDTVMADQIADRLSEDQLGDPKQPYVLDRYCTVAYFETAGSDPPDRCRYDGESIRERLDIPDTTSVNVTIERNATVGSAEPDTLCWDSAREELTPAASSSCGTDDTELSGGDSLAGADGSATITARRVVSLHGQDVTLKVVVW